MNRRDAANAILDMYAKNGIPSAYEEFELNLILGVALESFAKLETIDKIINETSQIQEDVIRYKMICEVMKNE